MGGAENDTLTGGSADDDFIIGGGGLTFAQIGIDRITDFAPNSDRILVSLATFQGLDGLGQLGDQFAVVNSYTAATQSEALIVYNRANGGLFFNANGKEAGMGNGGMFANLVGGPTISSSDFVVIA
jgi:Ca2+-binding RTX toxin-like protein